MTKFYERLKELRTDKGLTQKRFAVLVGYSQQAISEWEKGSREPAASAILACALFFDVTTDYLLGLEHEDGSKVQVTVGGSVGGHVVIGNGNKVGK